MTALAKNQNRYERASGRLLSVLRRALPNATEIELRSIMDGYRTRGALPDCAFQLKDVLDAFLAFNFAVRRLAVPTAATELEP